jgi:hypothetical protein
MQVDMVLKLQGRLAELREARQRLINDTVSRAEELRQQRKKLLKQLEMAVVGYNTTIDELEKILKEVKEA